jgi:MFS family permease
MLFSDYFDSVENAIQYLIAVGSLVGILGFVYGLIMFRWGSKRMRTASFGIIAVSLLLLGVCGVQTGIKYFRI